MSNLQCFICERYVYRDKMLLNDNFLHLCDPYQRRIYEGMKAQGRHCRADGCTCAYAHSLGWCNKCGHVTQKVMLNA